MFGFFEKKCAECGMKLQESKVSFNGKDFCSQECSKSFEKNLKKKVDKVSKGCCH